MQKDINIMDGIEISFGIIVTFFFFAFKKMTNVEMTLKVKIKQSIQESYDKKL